MLKYKSINLNRYLSLAHYILLDSLNYTFILSAEVLHSVHSDTGSTYHLTLMSLFMAVDCAARTNPSISAPLKFLVSVASSERSTSASSFSCFFIVSVWIVRIWSRPNSSGRPADWKKAQLFILPPLHNANLPRKWATWQNTMAWQIITV